MRIIIEPTEHFFMHGDIMVRMWGGNTSDGGACIALVTMVGFPGQAETIADGLVEIPPPDAEAQQRWAERIMATGPKAGGGEGG